MWDTVGAAACRDVQVKGRARPVVGQDDATSGGDAAGAGDGGEATESRGAVTGVATCRSVAGGCAVDFVGDE